MKKTKKLLAVLLVLCMMTGVFVIVSACTKNLTSEKQAAITALDTFADTLKSQNVYSGSNLELFDSKVAAAKEKINAAESQEEIDETLATVRTELQAIPADVQATTVLRAKNSIDATLADLTMRFSYTNEQQAQINSIVSQGKADLDALITATESSTVITKLNQILTQLRAIQGTRNKFTNVGYSSSISHTWNPHTYESSEEADLFAYITMGLYEFVLNDTKDGYDIVPELAAEMAVDVTKDYVGQFGVTADDEGKVWKVVLNQAAKWENGDPIKASDYLYSMKALLDPNYRNYRASSFTSSDGELFGAKKYFNAAQANIFTPVADKFDSIAEAEAAGYKVYFDAVNFWGAMNVDDIEGNVDGQWVPWDSEAGIDDGESGDDPAEWPSSKAIVTNYINYLMSDSYKDYLCYRVVNEDVGYTWEDGVGFFTKGDYEIYFALVNSVDDFYFYYSVQGFPFLVHQATYEKCLKETEGLWTSSYYSSMETTISYGPYKMSEYQQDKKIAWTVNENWYGWTDGKHDGLYQTTDITIDVIANQATAFNMFLQGKFDSVSVTSAQMATYRSGPNTVFTPSTNTWKFTFNSSKEALAKRETTGKNKTLLSYSDFRKAIGLSIDKEQFVAQNFPASMPGFGLINNMYVYDYNTGATYRSSDIAKQVLVEYYGLEYGEGKEYATLDAAYAAMTGYSKEQALELFRKAFADAKAAGDYKDGDVVELEMLMYSSDQTYIDVFNFAFNAIKAVIAGTELEGKIVLVRNGNGGEEFYDVMDAGETDIIMSAWGGGQFDPFGTICCYLDPDLYSLHEYGANIGKKLTLEVEGTSYTMSLTEWSRALNSSTTYEGKELSFKTASFETRLFILAQLEKAFLDLNAVVPLWYVTGASMHSYKVNYGTDTYVNLVGFGGIREMTYNYTDAEWAAWVASQLANSDKIDYTQKPAA